MCSSLEQTFCSMQRTMEGYGLRHKGLNWTKSDISGCVHRTFYPNKMQANEKEFVLVIGDSHLRAFVDSFVAMPEGRFCFGFMSTPGGDADALRQEICHADDPPLTPDIVCLLAPSNNLMSSPTIETAAKDFKLLLQAALYRWPQLFVLDFPVRHGKISLAYQLHLKAEYHRVAAQLNVRYFSTEAYFPLCERKLWCHDGIHLSDDYGMDILAKLIWHASYSVLHVPVNPAPLRLRSVKHRCPTKRSKPKHNGPQPEFKRCPPSCSPSTRSAPDTRMRCRQRRQCLPAHLAKKTFLDIYQGEPIPMCYPLSCLPVEEPTLSPLEDLVSPVPVRGHPAQAHKHQCHKTKHHSSQPPSCHPEFPTSDDGRKLQDHQPSLQAQTANKMGANIPLCHPVPIKTVQPSPHILRDNTRTILHVQEGQPVDQASGITKLFDLKGNTVKLNIRLLTHTQDLPTPIARNKLVSKLPVGGAGEDSSIFHIAISIGAIHNIQLKSGNPNNADGNCLYESIIDNINSRDCFIENLTQSPEYYRMKWNSVGEQIVKSTSFYPAVYSEQQWEDAFYILKTTKQYDLEYFGNLAILNCAHTIKKDILIINTPWKLEYAKADGPLNVVYSNTLDPSNVSDTNIPLVLAYNGNHFESLIPVSAKDIKQTIDLVEAFKQNQYNIPVCLKKTYNLNNNGKRKSEEKEKNITDSQFDINSKSVQKVCKVCHKRFKNLLMHLKKSKSCQNQNDMDLLQKQAKSKQISKQAIFQAAYRQKKRLEDLIVREKTHDKCSEIMKNVCKVCQRQFKNLLMHLKKSKTCQTHYDMDFLQKQARSKQKSQQAKYQAAYMQKKMQQNQIVYVMCKDNRWKLEVP